MSGIKRIEKKSFYKICTGRNEACILDANCLIWDVRYYQNRLQADWALSYSKMAALEGFITLIITVVQ